MFSPACPFQRTVSTAILLIVLIIVAGHLTPAHAQYVETVPYTFTGASDGAAPAASLIADSNGNFYGTTPNGGHTGGSNCPGQNPPTGCGVVFELSPPAGGSGPWTETVLYTFTGSSDGAYPQASLIFDSNGNLYGTTSNGGVMTGSICATLGGCGVAFELTPPAHGGGSWTETVLYSFTGGDDGSVPYSNLIFDSNGNLYGTAAGGGANFGGTVFELTPPAGGSGPWTESTLYAFAGDVDGGTPVAGLVFDSSGNLYGTTNSGGSGRGVVFEVTPPTGGSGRWTETPIYTFKGKTDGGYPYAGVTFDTKGNLYGTTAIGGSQTGSTCKPTSGCGVVFELSPPTGQSNNWTETVLYTFTASTDGGYPYAGIIFDASGNLYGTTVQGGNSLSQNCSDSEGCGVVFELSPPVGKSSWSETVLYAFAGAADGGFPYAAPTFDATGNLFGTTSYGGNLSGSNCNDVGGCGVVYELTPQAGPVVKLSPASLIFSTQVVGTTSKPKAVVVTNAGSSTLDIDSIVASANFGVSSTTCGSTLAVGKSCKVMVTFTPTQTGNLTGTLTFTDNAANSPQTVQLSGTGVTAVTLTPASFAFKKTKVGATSAAKKFTLANNQAVTLSSINISVTGDFAIQSTTCGASLASKQKCAINVTFTPTKTGARTGQLNVSDNAPGSPQTAALSGTGT
jgi:hypothetical protein